ncbi:hypothetical protein MKEN_00406300 [Mycena kentingensis (nom. inval.)]|nr:hypothetical protein MKEN_00406300 [Mycena kentingensis (nom. inval.)]
MRFSDLDEDLIPHILGFCDVRSVLRTGQTSKLLRELSQKRVVWRSLLEDLAHRNVLHALPPRILDNPLEYPASYLYDEVKRAVCGPMSWRSYADNPPKMEPLAGRAVEWTASAGTAPVKSARVLPGGRYAFLRQGACAELWRLETPVRLWSYEERTADHVVMHGDIELPVTIEASFARILLCSYRSGLGGNITLKVIEVSLEMGELESATTTRVVFEYTSPHPAALYPNHRTLALTGDFFMLQGAQEEHSYCFVVNWRTNDYATFRIYNVSGLIPYHNTPVLESHLTPKHLILVYTCASPPHRLRIAVYPIADLPQQYWFPFESETFAKSYSVSRINAADATPLVDQEIQFDGRPFPHIAVPQVNIALLKSVLVHDQFVVQLYVVERNPSPDKSDCKWDTRAALLAFSLYLSPRDSGLSWRLSSAYRAEAIRGQREISLAGYAFQNQPPMGLYTQPGDSYISDMRMHRGDVPPPAVLDDSAESAIAMKADGWRITSIGLTTPTVVWIRGMSVRVVYYE